MAYLYDMKPNALIHESSPYLLQHANNPVNWQPWSEQVFEQAKKEDKLVLVSIGYSACHWCHVMEHESFEDAAVADVMNAHFINIKVDREERPDVDMLYMSAVQLMSGQGGWPLNCFVLPDGRPVYGGTYFQKAQWLNILQNLSQLYANDKNKVLEYADNLTAGIKQSELISARKADDETLSSAVPEKCIANWKKRFDTEWGGPNRAPKFPLPNNYSFLLKYGHLHNDSALRAHVELTLQKMACGAIYDQLGGGFARYSTDVYWKVPHFEKMLYDNAQLVTLYCEAFRLTKNNLYREVVTETLSFVEKEWLSPEGGFYSALDADSEGVEGKYYVWQKEELEQLLGKDFGLFADYYNINEKGYWEDENYVLMRTESPGELMLKHHLKEEELRTVIDSCKAILMKARNQRVKPGLDNKILTSWNALMCKAYSEASLTFKNGHYKSIALKNASFLKDRMLKKDGSLWRSFSNGTAKISGFLDDYAFAADAFLMTYTISQDESWLKLSEQLCKHALDQFYNPDSGLFYYTGSSSEKLAVRT
ncbi:MAG: thioredoxin domain-containing protein, partial [Bacteroidia bacterium]